MVESKHKWKAWLYLAPAIVLLLIFTVWPIINTVRIAFLDGYNMLGAVGGPKWDDLPGAERPEKALLKIRSGLGLYANLRPAIMHKALAKACPIKPENVGDSMDLMIVRELTGGMYFGEPKFYGERDGEIIGLDTLIYKKSEVERIARAAFDAARKRRKNVISIDKANVLEPPRLWRETVHRIAEEYPDVTVTDMLVDNAAMQLVRNPGQFDVIATSNMFGDILSDEASQITGSIGMLAPASLGDGTGPGLYEPIHGSAPDIAGQDKANPLATILSCAMLLRYDFGLAAEADAIEAAVEKVLDAGWRTGDIAGTGAALESVMASGKLVGTKKMGDLVLEAL